MLDVYIENIRSLHRNSNCKRTTLYFSVAEIPTLWNLYIVFLMVYFISIVWMKREVLEESSSLFVFY
ncbi:hypothetical protein COJ50_07850 [Bacillus cereus]|uniref:Uncharacterized protein n=1 Tax=Bacillus cereus TaxID=1396 RepID=A0A2B1KRS5_BACCE|nr:hypothetical protein COJ50_07850 [Bacillus cereus]